MVLLVTFIGGCAISPQTGQLEINPSFKNYLKSSFNSDDPCSNNSRNIGMVAGSLIGGLIGYAKKGGKGALVGVVAGWTAGGLIGHSLDNRRCELYKIAKANNLKLMSKKITAQSIGVSSTRGNSDIGLDVQLQNSANEFISGTAQLTPSSRQYLAQIAKTYVPGGNAAKQRRGQINHHKILIVGHTDEQDAASGVDLAKLSENRAHAVARVFSENGVPASNINYQGAGDMLPLASNSTEQGRKDNNRVQIVDVPSMQALKKYIVHREANPGDFMTAKINHATISTPQESANSKTRSSESKSRKSINSMEIAAVPMSKSKTKHHKESIRTTSVSRYGFSGTPLNGGYTINLGDAPSGSTFSLITSANAATPVLVGSCLGDHPHISTAIKNLATGKTLETRDAIPGLYGQPWMGTHGQSVIALLHVYAPKDAAESVPPVTVEFFKQKKNGKPSKYPLHVSKDSPVNVYQGSKATLYRVFVDGPVQCIDLYVPIRTPTANGLMIYPEKGKEYKSTGQYKSLG